MWQSAIASAACGYLSILCWIIVFAPQLWENYRRKSGDGLSMVFLVIWLAGDIFNLIGVIMQNLLPTMFLLSLWYTVADMGLIWQVIYYTRSSYISEEEMNPSNSFGRRRSSSTAPCEADPLLGEWHSVVKSKKVAHTHLPYVNTVCAVAITLTAVIPCYAYYSVHFATDYDRNYDHSISKSVQIIAQIFGWLSATLYVGSRIPQILKNWRKKSTEGLSLAMFAVAVLGNVFFTLSIFFKSTEHEFLLINLAWIIGAVGTLVFDFLIFLQFFIYRSGKKPLELDI